MSQREGFVMRKFFTIILVLSILFIAACTPVPATLLPPEVSETPPVTAAPTPAPEPEEELPEEPIDDMLSAEIAELQSNARYVFEQFMLPEMVLDFYREEMIDHMINLDVAGVKEEILSAWDYLTEILIISALRSPLSPYDGDEEIELMRQEWGLGDEHIVDVTIETLDEGITATIIKMLDMEQFLRSTYIAIVYGETEGMMYFTLEQSHGFHMFCFVGLDSRGSFFEVENTREAFIEAILYAIEHDLDAGATLQR